MEKCNAQANTVWDNVTHSRNVTKSGGKGKYKTQSSLVWDNVTLSRNGTMSGRKGKKYIMSNGKQEIT